VNENDLASVDKTPIQHDQQPIPHEENKPKKQARKRLTNNINKTVISVVAEDSTEENDLDKTNETIVLKGKNMNSTMPVMASNRPKRKSIQPTYQSKRKRTSK